MVKNGAEINETDKRKLIEKINKTKYCPTKKVSKIDKPLARLTKERRHKLLLSEKKRGTITINPMDIKKKINEYFFKIFIKWIFYEFDT